MNKIVFLVPGVFILLILVSLIYEGLGTTADIATILTMLYFITQETISYMNNRTKETRNTEEENLPQEQPEIETGSDVASQDRPITKEKSPDEETIYTKPNYQRDRITPNKFDYYIPQLNWSTKHKIMTGAI